MDAAYTSTSTTTMAPASTYATTPTSTSLIFLEGVLRLARIGGSSDKGFPGGMANNAVDGLDLSFLYRPNL